MVKRILAIAGVVIILGATAGGSYALGQHNEKKAIAAAINKALTPASSSSNSDIKVASNDSTEQAVKKGKLYNIGDTVTYSTESLKVNSAKTSNLVTSYGQAYPASAGTKYLIVNATVTNISKEPFTFNPFVLTGDDGTTINGDTSPPSYGENSLSSKTLNPGVPVTGEMLFSVPVSMTTTNIGGKNASTDVYAGVKLTF